MIDRWYGVSCDSCHMTAEILESPSEAWAAARKTGWTRDKDWTPRGYSHFCPKCSPPTRDSGHQEPA